jgi:signal transduction histidine kinase
LFWWFGATIAVTALVVSAVVATFGPGSRRWRDDFERFQELGATAFRRSWNDAAARRALTEDVARAFRADVTVTDASGRELERVGNVCRDGYVLEVRSGDALLGTVRGCRAPLHHHAPIGFLIGLVSAAAVLWGASAMIARRLTRPLAELERVTRAIGSGDLAARVRLGRHQAGEVGALADSVNEMAGRIERQLKEERALLAAVSHELRSPLARLRVLLELASGEGVESRRLAEIESEIVGIDALIGKLLASSRLEFGTLTRTQLEAGAVGRRALEAAGLPAERLEDRSDGASVEVDPTLIGRALGNLIENAERHAGGVERLVIDRRESDVVFEVLDRGPGFSPEVLRRAFEPFYSASKTEETGTGGSLGLGLSLVSRIARAHGGRAFAENRTEGGARAVLSLPAAFAS